MAQMDCLRNLLLNLGSAFGSTELVHLAASCHPTKAGLDRHRGGLLCSECLASAVAAVPRLDCDGGPADYPRLHAKVFSFWDSRRASALGGGCGLARWGRPRLQLRPSRLEEPFGRIIVQWLRGRLLLMGLVQLPVTLALVAVGVVVGRHRSTGGCEGDPILGVCIYRRSGPLPYPWQDLPLFVHNPSDAPFAGPLLMAVQEAFDSLPRDASLRLTRRRQWLGLPLGRLNRGQRRPTCQVVCAMVVGVPLGGAIGGGALQRSQLSEHGRLGSVKGLFYLCTFLCSPLPLPVPLL
mmetsp:Transcript_2267/g.6943  ORF Transcript_2267/g.6943 Transcript_2267/m.6943 type:complete len:294 (-) Transcript_2267:258-1139(-)